MPKEQTEPFRSLPVTDLPSLAIVIEAESAQVIANGFGVPWPNPQSTTALTEHRSRFELFFETIQRSKDQRVAFCLLDRPGPSIGWVIAIDCISIPNIAQDMLQKCEGGSFGELNQQKFNGADVYYFCHEKDPREYNPFLAQATRPDGMPIWTHESSLGLMWEFRSFFQKDKWLVLTNDLQCSKDVIECWSLGKPNKRDSISSRQQPSSPKHPGTLSVDVYPEKFAQVCTDMLVPEKDFPSQFRPEMTQAIAYGLSTLGTHFERIQAVFEVDDHGPVSGAVNFEVPMKGHREGLAPKNALLRTFDCIPKSSGIAGIFDDRWPTALSVSWNTDVGIPAFFELFDSFVGNGQADRVLSAVLGLNSENENKLSALMLRALSGTIDVGWHTDSTWVVRFGIRDAEAAQVLVDAISRSFPRESTVPKTTLAPSYGRAFLVGANDGAPPALDELITSVDRISILNEFAIPLVDRISILMRDGFIWLSSNSEIIESLSQDASRAPHSFTELAGTEISPSSTHAYAIGRFPRRPVTNWMSPQMSTGQLAPEWHPHPGRLDGQSSAPDYSQPFEERIPQTEPAPNEEPAQPNLHFEYSWQVEPSDGGLLFRIHRRERPADETVVPGELKEMPFGPGTT